MPPVVGAAQPAVVLVRDSVVCQWPDGSIAAKDRPTQFVVHHVVGHGVERTVVFGAGVVDVFVLFGGGEQHDHVELQRAFGAHENDQCVWWQRDGEVARSVVENGVCGGQCVSVGGWLWWEVVGWWEVVDDWLVIGW